MLTTLHKVGYQSPAGSQLGTSWLGKRRTLRSAPLRRWWSVLTSWRFGLSVGHAGGCSLRHEMFEKEEPAAMMFVDFQQEGRPVKRCLLGAGPVPEACSSFFREIGSPPGRPFKQRGWGGEVGKKEGVHNVHTLGFGSGRTGAGLGRIPYVWAGVQCLQGLEPGSSPTSGTVFPQVRDLFGVFSCAHCARFRR